MNSILIMSTMCGAVATYLLQRYAGLSPVVGSSLVGLTGALVGSFLGNSHIPAAVFCGSFVGMTSPQILSLSSILFAGIGAGVLYNLAAPFFVGYGGKLGTIAFVVVFITVWFGRFFNLFSHKK